MATTFKIYDGDVVINAISGRADMIGNEIGEDDIAKSRQKTKQDIRRSLSINRVRNGTGAGLTEIIGTLEGSGFGSVGMLARSRIRAMFNAIITQQRRRLGVRPRSERFREITLLQVIPQPGDRTSYRFRLDTRTETGTTIIQSGNILT